MSDQHDADLIERIRRGLGRIPVRDLPSPVSAMERGRRRRRVAAIRNGILSTVLAIAVVVPLVELSGLRGSGGSGPVSPPRSTPRHAVVFHATGTPPPPGERCPTPTRSVGYAVNVQPTTGAPGSEVVVTGNTPLFAPSGKYLGPSGKIGFWFNLPWNAWENIYSTLPPPSTNAGMPVLHLGEALVQGRCSYRVTFTVPDMPPGIYPLVLIEHVPGSSAALAKPISFHVTAPGVTTNASSPPASTGSHLLGIPFAVCDVTQLSADVAGDGVRDGLYVFSQAMPDGTCPSSVARTAFVGIRPDRTGPVVTDTNAALSCPRECMALATPGIGGVRMFAVRMSAGSFVLFRPPAAGGALTPIATKPPQPGPQRDLAHFGMGGFPYATSGFECLPNGQVESWFAALTREGNGPYSVEEGIYALRGDLLVRLSRQRSTVPPGDPAALPQSGGITFGGAKVLCDSQLAAAP
jgi:hypothetical protein